MASADSGGKCRSATEGGPRTARPYLPVSLQPKRQTGRLVPLGDAEQVAQAIISLLRDSKTRQHMTDAARTAVKEKFSLARMVNETEALYREALEE